MEIQYRIYSEQEQCLAKVVFSRVTFAWSRKLSAEPNVPELKTGKFSFHECVFVWRWRNYSSGIASVDNQKFLLRVLPLSSNISKQIVAEKLAVTFLWLTAEYGSDRDSRPIAQ